MGVGRRGCVYWTVFDSVWDVTVSVFGSERHVYTIDSVSSSRARHSFPNYRRRTLQLAFARFRRQATHKLPNQTTHNRQVASS
jgi:hypothetical protein